MKFFALFLMVIAVSSAQGHEWRANDVTVLLPLPKTEIEKSSMLQPASQGPRGPLLPGRVIAKLPSLVDGVSSESVFSDRLRVVALRLDPCFREGSEKQCRRQIRLVWQPLTQKQGAWQAMDAALHSFYEMNEPEWNAMLAQYERLVSSLPFFDDATGVHPVLASEGLAGPFASKLRDFILEFCGEVRLTRVTTMSLEFGMQWVFRGWDITPDTMERIAIPGLLMKGQIAAVDRRGSLDVAIAVSPLLPLGPRKNLVNDARGALGSLTLDQILAGAREAAEIENPERHNPGTIDCVSCHTAGLVVSWSLREFPQWASQLPPRAARPVAGDVLRAFGYFDRDPIVSQRTLNETAAVRAYLNAR